MSEVKLYSRDEWDESSSMFVSIPATNAEIKAAHPKCRTCAFKGNKNWYGYKYFVCQCTEPSAIGSEIEPQLDYCRHHTPKEET